MKNVSDYEQYILERGLCYGYDGVNTLADAMQMSQSTLYGRLTGKTEWSLEECRRLKEVLHLPIVPWVMITLYHLSPYDRGYKVMAHNVFDKLTFDDFLMR